MAEISGSGNAIALSKLTQDCTHKDGEELYTIKFQYKIDKNHENPYAATKITVHGHTIKTFETPISYTSTITATKEAGNESDYIVIARLVNVVKNDIIKQIEYQPAIFVL